MIYKSINQLLSVLILLACLFIGACQHKSGQWVDPAEYHCSVVVNGENTSQGILISSYKDSLLSMAMERTTPNTLYWQIVFSPFSKKTQAFVLHKRLPGQLRYGDYYASCCIPEPDYIAFQGSIWEDDSLTNILHLNVDTSAEYLSGSFSATFVNDDEPYDTVRMKCDTFSCYWK
ncbi:MAG TPA: hypothetical protein VE978_03585 [Chitinophagales bacterium]|nr:hypothetical protein [Chitinophagales bacterium]